MSSLMESPISSGKEPRAHSPWLSTPGEDEGLQVASLVLFLGC